MRNLKRFSLLCLLLWVGPLFAQVSSFGPNTVYTLGPGNIPHAVPLAPIVVCNDPATGGPPCTNLAATYTSPTGATTCAPGSVVTPGTNTCSLTADARGNFGFFAASGAYAYYFEVASVWYGPYRVVLGGTGGGGGGGGTITGVTTSNGIAGGGTTGTVGISLATCPSSQVLQSTGSGYACAAVGTGNVSTAPAGNQPIIQPAGTQFSVNNLSNIMYVSPSDNWSTTATVSAGSNVVSLTPCPRGLTLSIPGPSTFLASVYISGVGTPEAVPITATTCTQAGGANGTITFTAANSHGAGTTVGSASQGAQEAILAAPYPPVSYNQLGSVIIPPGQYTWQARVTIPAPYAMVDFSGSMVTCAMADTCLMVQDPANATYAWDVTIKGFTGQPGCNNCNFPMIEDNGQHVRFLDIRATNPNPVGSATSGTSFGSLIQIDNDQAAIIDGVDAGNSRWSHCDTTFCSVAIKGAGGAGNSGILWIKNSNLSLGCSANGVDNQNENTMRISDTVIQSQAQFGVRATASFSNNPAVELDNTYFEVAGCANSNPLGIGVAGLIVTNGFASVKNTVGPVGSAPLYANTGATQYNYYIVAHSSTVGYSAPFLMGIALTNQTGSITVKWPQFGTTGTVTYDVIRTSGSANTPAPYTAVCTGGSTTACGSVVTGLTIASACSAVGSSNICSFSDTASASTSSYTVANFPNYFPALGTGAGTFWPGSVVLSPTADTGSSPSPSGVHFDRYGDNVADLTTNPVSQVISNEGPYIPRFFAQQCVSVPGGNWVSCLEGNSSASSGYVNASLMSSGMYAGPETAGLKGRLNFEQGPVNIVGGERITLVDCNFAKTLATGGFRPSADSCDTYAGLDNGSAAGPGSAQLAFGAPISISHYIGHLADNSSYLERLTASLKTFNVNTTVNGNFTVTGTCTGCGALPAGSLGFTLTNTNGSATYGTTKAQGVDCFVMPGTNLDDQLNWCNATAITTGVGVMNARAMGQPANFITKEVEKGELVQPALSAVTGTSPGASTYLCSYTLSSSQVSPTSASKENAVTITGSQSIQFNTPTYPGTASTYSAYCTPPGVAGVGTVSVSGSAVTWVSGTQFTTGGAWNNQPININGALFTVSVVNSATSLTLTGSSTPTGTFNYSTGMWLEKACAGATNVAIGSNVNLTAACAGSAINTNNHPWGVVLWHPYTGAWTVAANANLGTDPITGNGNCAIKNFDQSSDENQFSIGEGTTFTVTSGGNATYASLWCDDDNPKNTAGFIKHHGESATVLANDTLTSAAIEYRHLFDSSELDNATAVMNGNAGGPGIWIWGTCCETSGNHIHVESNGAAMESCRLGNDGAGSAHGFVTNTHLKDLTCVHAASNTNSLLVVESGGLIGSGVDGFYGEGSASVTCSANLISITPNIATLGPFSMKNVSIGGNCATATGNFVNVQHILPQFTLENVASGNFLNLLNYAPDTTKNYSIGAAGRAVGRIAFNTNSQPDQMTSLTLTANELIGGTLGITGLTTATGGLVIPNGATETIQSGGTLTCAAGSTCPNGLAGLTTDGSLYATSASAATSTSAPSTNSTYTPCWAVTASTPVAPTPCLPGVPFDVQSGATPSTTGASAGSTTPATDRATLLQTTNNTTSTALAVGQSGAAGYGSFFTFLHCNTGTVVATDTPNTSTINGNATTKLTGLVAGHNPECQFFYGDNTNWWGPEITATDANGRLAAEAFPALTGPVTTSAGSLATTVTPGGITNAMLANPATTVNTATCTLGSTCTAYPIVSVANAGSTGTTTSTLTTVTGAPSTAVIVTAGATGGSVGVCIANCGTTGNATIQLSGLVNCVFSNATTAGDYVQISAGTNGDCADTNSGSYPSSGQVIGRVLSTNGGAGTYQIDLYSGEIKAGGVPCTTTNNSLQYDNSGSFGCATQFTFNSGANTIAAASGGIFDLSAATGVPAFKFPQVAGGTLLAGTSTANLSSPFVIQNTNSSNNNTSITAIISSPGTSTGQTTLNINCPTTQSNCLEIGSGGTVSAGVLSGQTKVFQVLPTGQTSIGAGPAITAGSAGGIGFTEGTVPTGASGSDNIYANSTNHRMQTMNGTTDWGPSAGTLAWLDQTGVSTANSGSAQNILASTPAAGHYRISIYIDQSAGCATLGLGALTATLGWTDATHARVGATLTLPVSTATTSTGDFTSAVQDIWAASGSAITVTDTYTACTTGTFTYDQHATVERLE